MKSAIAKDCINKFAVASDLSLAGQISKEDMALYLRDEIYAAVTKHQVNGNFFALKSATRLNLKFPRWSILGLRFGQQFSSSARAVSRSYPAWKTSPRFDQVDEPNCH
jgi:hypothetical protein